MELWKNHRIYILRRFVVVELVEGRPVRQLVKMVEARPSRSDLVLFGTSVPRLVT
jgi:hypothetical protein